MSVCDRHSVTVYKKKKEERRERSTRGPPGNVVVVVWCCLSEEQQRDLHGIKIGLVSPFVTKQKKSVEEGGEIGKLNNITIHAQHRVFSHLHRIFLIRTKIEYKNKRDSRQM